MRPELFFGKSEIRENGEFEENLKFWNNRAFEKFCPTFVVMGPGPLGPGPSGPWAHWATWAHWAQCSTFVVILMFTFEKFGGTGKF